MQFIIVEVRLHNFCLLHMDTDGQDALKREIRILDVSSVDFLIFIQQVGVLEFLDWLLSDLRNPVVHSKSTVFKDHLLKVFKFIAIVIVCLKVLE